MARMLGLSGRDGGGWALGGSRGASRRLKHRVERRREQLDFDREVNGWFRAPATYDPASDPSDCAHGCNGDCEAWGSERCTFLCHPTDEAVLAAQWAERTGHTTPAGDPDPGVLAAYAEHVERTRAAAGARQPSRAAPGTGPSPPTPDPPTPAHPGGRPLRRGS